MRQNLRIEGWKLHAQRLANPTAMAATQRTVEAPTDRTAPDDDDSETKVSDELGNTLERI